MSYIDVPQDVPSHMQSTHLSEFLRLLWCCQTGARLLLEASCWTVSLENVQSHKLRRPSYYASSYSKNLGFIVNDHPK